jgi:two-component system LytT family response regulator
MAKVLIIDDEINAISLLKMMIENDFPGQFIVEAALGAEEGLDKIMIYNPDLLLLDIEMPVMNGFDLLSKIPIRNFTVIFTTAFNQYAIQAIKYNALDYILKPIKASELQIAIKKFLESNKNNETYNKQIDNFLSKKNKNLAIPTFEGVVFLEIEKIIRCEAEGNYTNFFLNDGNRFVSSKTMKEYEDLLVNNGNFIRVHRSHIVNIEYVKEFRNEGSLIFKDNTVIPISRRRKEEVVKKLSADK